MTLAVDSIDPREDGRGTRFTISCDYPRCGEHLHVGILRPGTDPRLAAELTGWSLDVDDAKMPARAMVGGWDFCPMHRAKLKT